MTELRIASFNASLNRSNEGDLIADLTTPDDTQAQAVAEVIQRVDPDILLINEFDFDADGTAAGLFQDNYLSVSQNGQGPVDYPFVYVAPSNTGVPSGVDLDNDGGIGGPGDAQGFGFFEGQFAFVIYSKYEIDTDNIRTFQEFLWKDMPDNLLPADPEDADGNSDTENWYTEEELEVLRLSSKNHVDVPVIVDGEVVHILASHPTPPVFDGPEDRNGTRNHDEIRFWSDYVTPGEGDYIYDDDGVMGGLAENQRFVIMGDQNSDPFDGDSVPGAAEQIIDNPFVLGSTTDASITPSSTGGTAAATNQAGANTTHTGNPAFDTADFGFAGFTDGVQNPDAEPGNLRVDYALPSLAGFDYVDGGVFWQAPDEEPFPLAEFPTSDHRLVFIDVAVEALLEAADDAVSTVEGVALSADAATGVLSNDSGPAGDDLAASLVSDVANGTLSLNADGSFDYTPDAGFFGEDSFVYAVTDGEATQNATATITVEEFADQGSAGRDRFTGREGLDDTFVFEVGDTDLFTRDRITDFEAGDTIDLTALGFTSIAEGRNFPLGEGVLNVIDYPGDNAHLIGRSASADVSILVAGAFEDVLAGILI